MMLSLNNKGYSAFNIQAPSLKELADIAKLTAPLLLSMISKVKSKSSLSIANKIKATSSVSSK